MPIFEFICQTCTTGRRFSALVGVVAGAAQPQCPVCGGVNLRKAVSRFARLRSDDEAMDALAERADTLDESNPKAMRALMQEMAGEMGEGGDDFGELMDAAMEEEATGSGGSDTEGEEL